MKLKEIYFIGKKIRKKYITNNFYEELFVSISENVRTTYRKKTLLSWHI